MSMEAVQAQDKDEIALLRRVNCEKPTPADVAALRGLLDRRPELYRQTGDIARRVLNNMIAKQGNALVVETLKRQVEEMRAALGYEDATQLEQMLIEQILLCWLRVSVLHAEHYAVTAGSHTLTSGVYWDKRLTSAQQRFDRAVESLARMRKLQAQTALAGAKASAARALATLAERRLTETAPDARPMRRSVLALA